MTLSIKDCLRFGWETFKKRPWLLILALAIGVVIEGVTTMIEEATAGDVVAATLGILVALLISMVYAVGHTHLFLKAHDAPAAARVKDLWYPKAYWRFLCTSVLLWLFIGLPYLALVLLKLPDVVLAILIIPALVVSLVFGFALYLVVDKDLGPIDALKESARITKGHRLQIFFLLLAVIGINLLGLLALVIGLLVTIPTTVLAMVHAYRTLSETLSLVPTEEAVV
ncbi:MAG: DUF975 family protein [Patescibacteria group bacterium]